MLWLLDSISIHWNLQPGGHGAERLSQEAVAGLGHITNKAIVVLRVSKITMLFPPDPCPIVDGVSTLWQKDWCAQGLQICFSD